MSIYNVYNIIRSKSKNGKLGYFKKTISVFNLTIFLAHYYVLLMNIIWDYKHSNFNKISQFNSIVFIFRFCNTWNFGD